MDAVWVTWVIDNGPVANITITDTYSNTGKLGVDLEDSDPIGNNWHLEDWTEKEAYTCTKINSGGCDILTAKIFRYWHEYNTFEDFDM